VLQKGQNASLLIGPEGDFTPEEISLAEAAGCTSVSLGNTRLRTETAALAACALYHLVNDETV
jgi:16S rRNA (uracil1498-N3)-methyltransferase